MSGKINTSYSNQSRRLWLFRISMLIAVLSYASYMILYILIDFQKFSPLIISIFIYLLINAGVYVLYRLRKYLLAIHIYSISLILEMLIITFFILGKAPGVHYFFILFALVPLPFFPSKKIIYPLIYFTVSVCCFLYVEFFNPTSILEYPQNLILPVKLSAIVLSLGTLLFLFNLYYSDSEKKEYELNEANQTKNLFFSIISHDLKNPISALVGLIDVLDKRLDTSGKEEITKMVRTIAFSANSLQNLIFDLLEWSRTQTGRIEAKYAPVAMKDLIDASEAVCRDMSRQKGINFRYSIPRDLVIETDESLLGTVIRNLFSNAIKYSYPGGEITVSLMQKGSKVILSIKDNGVGMADEIARNLFKIDKVQTTLGTNQEKGTGLGLIISHEFIQTLNGSIDVQSSEGEGCEFLISLPSRKEPLHS